MTARTRSEMKAQVTALIDQTGSGGTSGADVESLMHDLADSSVYPADAAGSGDMAAATYDPGGVGGDAFDMANMAEAADAKVMTAAERTKLAGIEAGATGDQTAAEVPFTPAGGLAATDVAGALAELDTEKAPASHTHTLSQISDLTATAAELNTLDGITATVTELNYTDGVTSAIQTQLDGKAATSHAHAAADVTSGVFATARLGSGTASSSTYLRGDGTWETPAGSGDVAKVGTPVANRMAYWTGDGTLGHDAGFTYDAGTDTLTVTKIVIGGITFDGQNQLSDPNADRLIGWDDSAGTTAYFAPTGGLEISGTDLRLTAAQRTSSVQFVIDGGGSAITTGQKGHIHVPMACTITAAHAFADQSGSIVVDIWKDTYANFPPTDADSITASAPVTISATTKAQNTTLSGWTTSVSAGDILAFNVDSAATVTRVTVVLTLSVA